MTGVVSQTRGEAEGRGGAGAHERRYERAPRGDAMRGPVQGHGATSGRVMQPSGSAPNRRKFRESENHACGLVARSWRFTAEMMAFSAEVVVEESMPTPQITSLSDSSPISHST